MRGEEACALLELLHRQMLSTARAGRCVVDLAGVSLGIAHKVLHGLETLLRVGHQHKVGLAELGHRHQVVLDVIRQVALHIGHDGDGTIAAHQQGVAIGLGLDHGIHGRDAACCALVLHHNGLLPFLAHHIAHLARQQIRRAARAVRHHQLDGARRKIRLLSHGCTLHASSGQQGPRGAREETGQIHDNTP